METSRSNIKDTFKQRNTRANESPVEYAALSDWTGTNEPYILGVDDRASDRATDTTKF